MTFRSSQTYTARRARLVKRERDTLRLLSPQGLASSRVRLCHLQNAAEFDPIAGTDCIRCITLTVRRHKDSVAYYFSSLNGACNRRQNKNMVTPFTYNYSICDLSTWTLFLFGIRLHSRRNWCTVGSEYNWACWELQAEIRVHCQFIRP